MRLIDADKFERVLNEQLLPKLVERYGEKDAVRGLHFSFRDCICNIQAQPTVTDAVSKSELLDFIADMEKAINQKDDFIAKASMITLECLKTFLSIMPSVIPKQNMEPQSRGTET